MAVNINVPSQVKTYANLAAFPATGALKTIYIAEDTNKTYRWTGSVYVEVSASASGITIGSTAIASGVVGRVLFEGAGNVVQESSSLFWDDTNQQLQVITNSTASAQRGLSVSQFGDFIGAAPMQFNKARGTIASPTNVNANDLISSFSFNARVGGAYTQDRALFGANMATSTGIGLYFIAGSSNGNFNPSLYIHPSGNAVFGTTQSVLTGITDSGFRLDVNGTARVQNDLTLVAGNAIRFGTSLGMSKTLNQMLIYGGTGAGNAGGTDIHYWNGSTFAVGLRLNNNANVLINTTTDDGFRLDVNGTARLGGTLTTANVRTSTDLAHDLGAASLRYSTVYTRLIGSGNSVFSIFNNTGTSLTIPTTNNILIGTTTDAGFRLDVNGTARVQGQLTVSTGGISVAGSSSFTSGYLGIASTGSGGIYGLTANQPMFLWNRQTGTGNGIVIDDFNGVAGGNLNLNLINISGAYSTFGTCVHNTLMISRAINMASGTQTVRGFYYNPTLTNTTGLTTHYAIHTAVGRIRFENLPTSSAGLSAGELWNDAGTLKIV